MEEEVWILKKKQHGEPPPNRDSGGKMAGLGSAACSFHFSSHASTLEPKSQTGDYSHRVIEDFIAALLANLSSKYLLVRS